MHLEPIKSTPGTISTLSSSLKKPANCIISFYYLPKNLTHPQRDTHAMPRLSITNLIPKHPSRNHLLIDHWAHYIHFIRPERRWDGPKVMQQDSQPWPRHRVYTYLPPHFPPCYLYLTQGNLPENLENINKWDARNSAQKNYKPSRYKNRFNLRESYIQMWQAQGRKARESFS